MRNIGLSALLVTILLGACATNESKPGRVVERLPPTAVTVPALPKLGMDDLVRLAREGLPAESIIARLKESQTRLRLSAGDVLSLKGQGVPLPVIDHLLDSDRQAALDECSERINRLVKGHVAELQQAEMLCWQRCSLNCSPWPGYPWRRW